MKFRMQPIHVVANVAQPLKTKEKTEKINCAGVNGTAAGAKGSVRTGSTIAVHSNFEQFLAEQTTLQSAKDTKEKDVSDSQKPSQPTRKTATRGEAMHTLQQGETIWELARERYQVDPAEILRRNNITNPGKLRVGQEIRIPAREQSGSTDSSQEVTAGWYGKYHHGKLMANGKRFDMHGATIAHREIPIGTKVELENPKTGEKAKAVVTDRGPYHEGRDVDLSYGLAKRLSLAKQGVGNLKMRVL